MLIRQARQNDAASIRNLLGQLGYPDLTVTDVSDKIKSHEQAGYSMLVAEEGQEVIGFISLHWFDLAHWKGKMGRITSFCVDEKFRSRGIGLDMLKAGEDLLKKAGCVKLEVTSNNRRDRAHAFYLKHGYAEDSRRFVKYL